MPERIALGKTLYQSWRSRSAVISARPQSVLLAMQNNRMCGTRRTSPVGGYQANGLKKPESNGAPCTKALFENKAENLSAWEILGTMLIQRGSLAAKKTYREVAAAFASNIPCSLRTDTVTACVPLRTSSLATMVA